MFYPQSKFWFHPDDTMITQKLKNRGETCQAIFLIGLDFLKSSTVQYLN